jgi:GH15 family glucan-1,4-alpha-glucosidase
MRPARVRRPKSRHHEEYDVEQRQLRGNFPQAFVHAVMIEAAQKLANAPGETTP